MEISFGGVDVAAGERGVGFAHQVVDARLGGDHVGAQGEAGGLLLPEEGLEGCCGRLRRGRREE